MSAFTLGLRRSFLSHVFRNRPLPPPPSSLHVALFTALPDEDGVGGVEVSALGYERIAIATGEEGTGAGSGWSEPNELGEVENVVDLLWPVARAPWGAIAGIGLYDADGALWALGEPDDEPIMIVRNDQYRVAAGALRVRME